jgi:hypothetical protein
MSYNPNNIVKKTIYCLIVSALLMLNTVLPTYSAGFEIIQFTNNAFDDLAGCYYNVTIAWTQDKNNDGYEILYWNGTDTVQVTQTDSYNDFLGSCHNGQISWSGDNGGVDKEIFFWDGNSIIQVTNDNSHDWSPSLYNGTIAWYSYATGSAQIYYWDGTTTRQITNSGYNFGPSLYNGTIAWDGMSAIGMDHEIYYWDGSSIRQITNNDTDDQGPSLYNGTIAWRGFDGVNYEIFYWNGTSIIQITNNNTDNGWPSLYNGKIAWVASDGSHPQVYFWDGASITQVTNTNTNKDGCQLYDGVITWAEYDGNDREIYYARPDNTQPTVFSTLPADLDANISVNQWVSATFSEAMIGSTINDVTFSINNGVTGVVTYNAGNFTATLTPSTALNFRLCNEFT